MTRPRDAAIAAAASELIDTAQAMNRSGINRGTAGNVSVRVAAESSAEGADVMLVTPSSVPYDVLTPDDVVVMAFDGAWSVGNGRRPSSEWRFHLDVLRARPDVAAVVHAHPVHATALAVHERGIEPFHYMVAVAGGRDIRCAPYATFGTQELSDHVLAALEGRRACLMAHHGMLACGASLPAALALAVEVETLAEQYVAALALGAPDILDDAEMARVLDKMSSGEGYGSS